MSCVQRVIIREEGVLSSHLKSKYQTQRPARRVCIKDLPESRVEHGIDQLLMNNPGSAQTPECVHDVADRHEGEHGANYCSVQ